ncbi:MAG: hypothetical protein IKE43_01105 [Coriobacteriales bacterium]|nr:hypothetical protein [Coriobacteriales bacterium]
MDDQDFEQKISRLMRLDLSAGTEAFRDALSQRCFAELDANDESECLDDDELGLLAAAGEKTSCDPTLIEPYDTYSGNSDNNRVI